MDKTVVVKVADYEPHPRYKKIMESNKRLSSESGDLYV
jgi:ribosomal protein S17